MRRSSDLREFSTLEPDKFTIGLRGFKTFEVAIIWPNPYAIGSSKDSSKKNDLQGVEQIANWTSKQANRRLALKLVCSCSCYVVHSVQGNSICFINYPWHSPHLRRLWWPPSHPPHPPRQRVDGSLYLLVHESITCTARYAEAGKHTFICMYVQI